MLSPKTVHAEQVIRLLEAGVDVFCEKPMGMTLKEAYDMADASAHTGKLMIAFNRRYAPVYRRPKKVYGQLSPMCLLRRKTVRPANTAPLLKMRFHMVDILRYFCGGECVKVEACSKFTDPLYETLATAQLQFENGSVAMLVADRASGQWVETLEMHGHNKKAIFWSTVRTQLPLPMVSNPTLPL